MPRTSFTCRDKILGGYYADPETNCQMFHICVKVAGVGIQDFRFLCPNGTAFDQEAQICADWGDVDCEAATIFYGANNFDLYRIGSNFESKRGNFADEDESIFHLQRAESNDARRSKQYVVNQNSIQSHNKPTTIATTTTRRTTPYTFPQTTTTTSVYSTISSTTPRPTTTSAPRSYFESSSTREFVSTYKPTLQPKSFIDDKAVISTFRPQNANDYFNRARASSNDDEIFKQSQSSHFYNNRNNGKEDFEDDFEKATKAPAKQKVRGRQRGRSKFRNTNGNNINAVTSAPVRNNNYQPPTTLATTQRLPLEQNTRFTSTPIVVQPISNQHRQNVTQLQASNSYPSRQTSTFSSTYAPTILVKTTDETFVDVPKIKQKVQTTKLKSASAPLNVVPLIQQSASSSTFAPPPPVAPQFNFDSFQQNFGAIPQRVIIPSQISKEERLKLQASNGNLNALNNFQTPSTSPTPTTPVTPQQFSRANQQNEQKTKSLAQKFNFKTQKYEFVEPQNPTTQFYNPKYETKGSDQSGLENINLEPTKSGFVKVNNKTYAQRQTTTGLIDENKPTTFNPQQYYQSDQYQNLSPRGFSLAAQQQQQKKTPAPEIRPQITSRSEARNHKKFSTLVPKDQYNPTTFKPNTYSKKPLDTKLEKISNPNQYYSQFITNTPTIPTTSAPIQPQFTQTTTSRYANFFSTSSTPRPLQAGEEDDGLYRPDLYEKDLFKNKARTTKVASTKSATTKTTSAKTIPTSYTQSSSAPLKVTASVSHTQSSSAPVKNTAFASHTQSSSAPVKNTLFQFYHTSTTSAPTIRSSIAQSYSDEDEFLKTEYSQNIFASGNQLRAEKEKEKLFGKNFEQFSETSSPRPFSKPTLLPSTTQSSTTTTRSSTKSIATKSTTFKQQPKDDKDVSYDYQYYDTNGDHEYPEIEPIEDFGRTVKKSSTN